MKEPKQIFIDYIKEKNLKWSNQREFIVDLFLSTTTHSTTEELYQLARKQFPQIGYATVYRTLKLLSECGLASDSHFADHVTRFESTHKNQHHDHLICTTCGKIVEFKCEEIEKMQENIARQKRFKVTHHRLELYGICKNCKQ
jgi:Fur family ferric uptake transcriptional regulator